ncbi:sensor histidine kinase [Nocardioides cavernaquae]|uniref:sensor histidine kinase n=1 Tax=Nocardioides cavernaquae TaxID=2321396 RepID=UPI001C7CE1F4|nr:HAMP domain-containing sensor histidine kinase [Nocardioides cavernaquae]
MDLSVRRLVPASMTARLVATVVLLVALVGLLVSALTTAVLRDHLADQLDDDVRAAQRLVMGMPGGPGRDPRFDNPRGRGVGTLTAVITSDGSAGAVQSGLTETALGPEALRRLASLPANGRPQTSEIDDLGRYRVVVRDLGEATLVSGLPTTRMDETINELVGWSIGFTVLAVGVAGGLAVIVVRRQLRPLRAVAQTAHEVAGLQLSTGEVGLTARVPDQLTDERTEVGQVGSALNTLLGHMETSLDARHRSEQQVRQFVADASHELRTPLATIQGYAELGLRADAAPDQVLLVLGKVQGESHRMTALVEDLLLLARLDQGRPLAREEVDLSRLAIEAVADARVVAPDHQWRMELPEDAVEVTGDGPRLHQVLANLLANASRHAPSGTTVTVAISAASDGTRVSVHDDGPGVPVDLQAHVFERFTRGDASRTRDSGGAGLGLSLARAIAEAHGGTLTLESVPGDTTFTLTLPS